MAKIIKEVCEVSKGNIQKESWWWNSGVVKKFLKEMKEKVRSEINAESKAVYTKCRNKAKRVTAKSMHEEAKIKVQKITGLKTEKRIKHNHMAKTEAMCIKNVIGS